MDPQQRLFLEACWHAFEHAGLDATALAGSRTGVFVGAQGADYAEVLRGNDAPQVITGIAHSAIANRVSYWLDLRGPSLVVDTACASGLAALHRADVEAAASTYPFMPFWVQASTQDSLVASLRRLGVDHLGAPESDPVEDVLRTVKGWLRARDGWLLSAVCMLAASMLCGWPRSFCGRREKGTSESEGHEEARPRAGARHP